jgi:UDP-N-acetyl-2-amino-2-deoxyglucuronate dehydrogenase
MKSRDNGFPDSDIEREKEIQALYDSHPAPGCEGYEGEFNDVLTANESVGDVLVSGREGRKTL